MIDNFLFNDYSPITGFTGFMEMGPLNLVNADMLKNASLLYLDQFKQHLGDSTIHTMVREGDFADNILEAAKKVHADIIVLGSHNRKWLENIVMGSVTKKVLDNTSIPLFIIPTKKHN